MRSFDPREHPVPLIHRILLSGVAPRPIALVGTHSADGAPNLSPFSFFNAFGANPPVVVVSPAYRGTDGTPKHTFENIVATGEFTVSAVSHAMLEQINLASSNYPRGVDEYVKSGLTPLPSQRIAPAGVAESPFVMECRLLQHVGTGDRPGSGNLLIGEVLLFHVRESAFDGERIDPHRLDLVARMGGDWYCRASGSALFTLSKPAHNGVGMDALPEHLRQSTVLTANDLARLAGVREIPDPGDARAAWQAAAAAGAEPGAPDDWETELRSAQPARALQALAREAATGGIAAGRLDAALQRVARGFLQAGALDAAWHCAWASDPAVRAER